MILSYKSLSNDYLATNTRSFVAEAFSLSEVAAENVTRTLDEAAISNF